MFRHKIALLCLLNTPILGTAYADSLEKVSDDLSKGAYQSALSRLQKTLKTEPENANAWFLNARALESLKLQKKAIQAYEKAIAIDPSNVASYNNLANLYSQQGNHQKAAETLHSALKLSPTVQQTFDNLTAVNLAIAKQHYTKH